jgi:uncharacterized protein (DUF1330 family)
MRHRALLPGRPHSTMELTMTTYAIANLRSVTAGPEIARYLERIDATLEPFGGRFVIHGGAMTVLEGRWSGDRFAIAFPDRARAEAWYASAAHQRILAPRTANFEGDVVIGGGVPEGHRATVALKAQDSTQRPLAGEACRAAGIRRTDSGSTLSADTDVTGRPSGLGTRMPGRMPRPAEISRG